MATRWAVATGNWSNPATWDGGTLPGAADDVYADGKTVTIDQSATVLTIRTTQRAGGTVGGGFVLNAGVTFTALHPTTGIIGYTSTSSLIYSEATGTATLVANLGNVGFTSILVDVTSTGHLNIVGNIVGGSSANGIAVVLRNLSTLTVIGSVTGGGNTNQGIGIYVQNSAIVNITGSIFGGTGSSAIVCYGGSSVVLIVGSMIANSVAALASTVPSKITVIGSLTASFAAPALSSSHISAVNKLSGPFINTNGTMAVYAQKMYLTDTTANRWEFTTQDNTPRNLYTADTIGGNPAVADVRLHTTYGPANELTGVCAVPPAASVSYGVPVDQTTGTALLDASAIASALNASALASDYTALAVAFGQVVDSQNYEQLAADYTALAADVGTLASSVVTLTSSVGTLASDYTALAGDYSTLDSSATQIAVDVGTLQSDVSDISARILEQIPEETPALVIPAPTEETMTTAYIYCYDEHGVPEEGVIIQIRLRALGTGLDGLAFDTARIEAVSNSDGLATAEIPRGASLQFQARRGTTGAWTTFAGANTETLELPALLGNG